MTKSTLDFMKVDVKTGGYGYQGYADNNGRKWILKWGTCKSERVGKTLANYFGVAAPRVVNVFNPDDEYASGEYHMVEYFDSAITANEYRRNGLTEKDIRPSLIRSAIRMVAFDSIACDRDRHDENVLVRNHSLISIDLEGAFLDYDYDRFNVREVTDTIHNNDILCVLFGEGVGRRHYVSAGEQMNINPRDYISEREARSLVERVRRMPTLKWTNRIARTSTTPQAKGIIAANFNKQRDLTVEGLTKWLSL